MESKKIFLIDICGTIYRSNTTFDFIRFLFARERWFRRMQRVRKHRIVGFLNMKIHQYFHIDIIRQYAISKLNGYSEEELTKMTSEFYDAYLTKVINTDVINLIEQKREDGFVLLLVSATLDCIANEVANRLCITQQYSSELEYKDGVCQGRLKTDFLATKLKILRRKDICLTNMEVITDNYSDKDLIKVSKHAYLVQYLDKKDKWNHFLDKKTLKKCEFIRI